MPDWGSLETPTEAKPKDRWAALERPAEAEPQYDPLLGIKTTVKLPPRESAPYIPLPREEKAGFEPLTSAPRERDESFYVENALSRLRAVDALTGQNQADNPAFIRAFVTKDGKLDVQKIDAYLDTVEEAHAATLPSGLALAAKFGHAVEGMTSLGFYHSMGEAEQKTVEENPTAHGPWGTAASAAGTILGAANPVGAVRLLTAGAKAARFGSLAPAVGFGTGVGIEKRDVGAGLEAAVFAGTAGPLGKWLRGANPSVIRRIGSEALASMGAGTAIEAAKGGPIDWSGQGAQAALLGVLSAGRASPIETGRDVEDALSEKANALSKSGAAQLHGDVRAQPAAREGQVPVDEGGAGVRGGGQPEGRAQAQGQEWDRGGGPSGPLRQVGAVDALALEERAQREDERGFIGLGDATSVADKLRATWQAIKNTKNWVASNITADLSKIAPTVSELIHRGGSIQNTSIDRAKMMVEEAAGDWSKADKRRLFVAYTNEQLKKQGSGIEDTPLFKKTFPSQADYDSFVGGSLYGEAAGGLRLQFETHLRPVNERAGAKGVVSALEGAHGEFSNLIPLSEDEVNAAKKGGAFVSTTSKGLSGPAISRSPNAMQRTGTADAYDADVEHQFQRALAKNGDRANKLDIVDEALKTKVAIPTTDAEVNRVEKPDGYSAITLNMGKGLRAGPPEAEAEGHVHLYIRDEAVAPFAARWGKNFMPEVGGLGEFAKKLSVKSQLFLNPGVGAAHLIGNVLPTTAINVTTSPIAGFIPAVKFLPRAVQYMLSDTALAKSRLGQADFAAAEKTPHQSSTTIPVLSRLWSGAGRVIDAVDAAAKDTSIDVVKSLEKSGIAKSTFDARNRAMSWYGEYHTLLQDSGTRALKMFLNPFEVIAKAGVHNVYSLLTGHTPYVAANGTQRAIQAAKVAGVVGALVGWKMIAAQNEAERRHETLPPGGIPPGADYDGMDPKTGKPMWHWSVLSRLFLLDRLQSMTPAAAAAPILRKESFGDVAGAAVGGPLHAVEHLANPYYENEVSKLHKSIKAGDWSKAIREFPIVKEVIDTAEGKPLDETIYPSGKLQLGMSAEDIAKKNDEGAQAQAEGKKEDRAQKAKAIDDARRQAAGR